MDSGLTDLHLPKTVRWAVLTAAALYFLLSLAILPYPGLQNDECLFAQPLYRPVAPEFRIRIGKTEIPTMLMSYVGTTKTLIYHFVFKLRRPSVWSIRVPGLITGAATIWMFALLLYRLSGSFAAVAGAFLLALDPIFLLTDLFDWGPVALQHLFLVGGILAIHGFYNTGSWRKLALGFACFGLGMWDKALFSWMLAGLVLASLLFLAKEIRNRLTARNAAIAIGAFVLGAAPLIVYNVHHDFETFRGNTKMAPRAEMWRKTVNFHNTLNGSGLFGYLVREEVEGPPAPPHNALERFSAWIRSRVGEHREDWLPEAMLLALAAVPLWWRRWKVVGFVLVTAIVAWLLMASTDGAGGSVHHVVLIWPIPQFLVAFCLGVAIENRNLWWPRTAALVVTVVCFSNLLVLNQYLYNEFHSGSGMAWSDAIFPLREALDRRNPEHVNMMDWGYEFNLLVLERGRTELHWGAEPGEHDPMTENDNALMNYFLENAPTSVWVAHLEPIEVTPGTLKRFDQRAGDRGYRKQQLEIIHDRNGREVFELYRFVKGVPAAGVAP